MCVCVCVRVQILIGSRCGPIDVALQLMEQHASVRQLLTAMTKSARPLSEGLDAMNEAASKGALKVQLICSRQ